MIEGTKLAFAGDGTLAWEWRTPGTGESCGEVLGETEGGSLEWLDPDDPETVAAAARLSARLSHESNVRRCGPLAAEAVRPLL